MRCLAQFGRFLARTAPVLRRMGDGIRPAAVRVCDTFWGSHGCELEEDHVGAHWCCCECVEHPDPESGCVGTAPYYGPETGFYHMRDDEQ